MTPIDDFSQQDFEAPVGADIPGAAALGNGHYAVLVTDAGTGYSACGGTALTRWVPDRTSDTLGFFLYIQDEDDGAWWSAGAQPSRRTPDRYDASAAAGRVELRRIDGRLETITEICVAPDADVELRRVTFVNHDDSERHLQLTTYAEVVLNTPEGDAGHPAFSKLFVQTDRTSDGEGLLAKRRPRSPDDVPLWLAHRMWTPAGRTRGVVELETDRARFIGSGRSRTHPRAMDRGRMLSNTVGNVLDPVLAIRRRITVPAHDSMTVIAMLAAASTREDVEAIGARYGSGDPTGIVDDAFTSAVVHASDVPDEMREHARSVERATRAGSRTAREVAGATEHALSPARADLVAFNGYGGFTHDGTEYVMPLQTGDDGLRLPPQPWTNVIANERIGFIASERGAMSTWVENSRKNRLTPWHNDPVSDPHGEALYVRDDDTGRFWSPTPGPVVGAGRYEVRHGFGYTRYLHSHDTLDEDTVVFVPRSDPVKLVRVRVTNRGDAPRRLSLYSYAHLVLGVLPWETAPSVVTSVRSGVIRATNPTNDEFASLVAFATAVAPHAETISFTTDRAAFLGYGREADDPVAFEAGRIWTGSGPESDRIRDSADPCAAIRIELSVPPGETAECVFLLGEGSSDAEVDELLARYRVPGAVDAALSTVRAFWLDLVGGVQVETPSPAIDLMLNGWLTYQNLSCRVWGRTAFYQSGGAFGFRDQLQDTAALVYLDPARTRAQIVLHASHQFVEGDVLHWWHPPTSGGIRTHFSDDLLWLPYVTAFYVETTGDASVLGEEAPYVTAPPLPLEDDEAFVVPSPSGTSASVYEHCCLAIERSLAVGAHGLPLMGTGDWNDGMNRVGREGRGESVWLGFFLAYVLEHFIPLCERRGDMERAARYREHLAQLATALNDAGWDGDWYRRAYYDDGTPLGSAAGDECRIDVIAQAWAVISGIAPPDRARMALDAMETHLVSEPDGIIRLLTPAFDKTPHDPGYIKGYLPGVRENGGQYTHGALWAVRALAELGRCDRAAHLLEMLSPVTHARDESAVATYQVEPYVIAADVYGVAPHVGRGGWTWYTGSAGWMFRVALESVLGVAIIDGRMLALRPCIPEEWPGFTLRYRIPGTETRYEIIAERAGGEISTVIVDGGAAMLVLGGALTIPLVNDGASHAVRVSLGNDVVPRYASRVLHDARGQAPSEAP